MIRNLFASLTLAFALLAAPAFAQRQAMNYQGAYASGTTYQRGDTVNSGGSTYVSIIVNNLGNAPVSNPSDWASIGSAGSGSGLVWFGAWSSSTGYAVNDVVSYGGSSYVAILSGTNQEPDTATTYWNLLAQKGATGSAGTNGTNGTNGATGATGPAGPNAVSTSTTSSISGVIAGGATDLQAATSAQVQTAIGASVYDAYGAAAARQANLSLLPGTYINGDLCSYVLSSTLLNCNTPQYTLPAATSSILGGVKPDGTSILNTAGTISVTLASIGAAASNASTTVNSQTCTLGSTCTIPFQTNSSGNTSQAGINLETSTTNTVGLTVTPTNSATNAEKFEVTGANYTGNAASATSSAIVASSETVTFSSTPTFALTKRASIITLTGSITTFTLGVGADGQDKTLCFVQGSGPYTVAGPANVHGLFTIGTTNGYYNCQHFTYYATPAIWVADTTGVINQ